MRLIKKGATSQTVYIEVLDSTSTTGGRKTGLAFGTSGLTAYYARIGAAATAITLVTQTASGAWSSGGFAEVDSANMPGVYRLDVPNAAVASGVDSVVVTLKGATGMAQVSIAIQLTGVDLQDATAAGLTNLDAAVSSRLAPTVAARTLDVSATGEAGVDWGNVGSPTTTVGLTGTTISSAQVVASVSGAVGSVTGSVASVSGAVGSVTGNVGGNVVGSVASVTGAVGSVTGNVGGNVVGSVGSVTGAVALTSAERNSVADAILDRNMTTGTDSGSSSVRTVRQALRFLRNKWQITSGTLTVYKEDDSTSSWTSTLTGTAGADPITTSDPA
jgi:hypothetical protein